MNWHLMNCKVVHTERRLQVVFGTLLLCLGISGASLWIDEGVSARLAVQPSLMAWAATLNSMIGSEPQMPGYQLYLWLWARLFGTSEWALRLANVPWALLFTASLAWGAEHVVKVRKVWLIICLSPFVSFYMNEARPYVMVMGLSMLTTIAVLVYARDPQRFGSAPWWAMVSLIALWFTHMLAITLVASLLIILYTLRSVWMKNLIRQWFWPVVITLPFFLCLSLYYMSTLLRGAKGAIEKPGLSNLFFSFYEFLGFGGLGPPRNVLRQSHGLRVLFPYLPTLGLGALALGVVALLILLHTRHSKERQLVIGLSIALAAGILITFTLSYIAHFRLLGRHLSAFFPLFSILLLTGLLPDDNQRRNKFALGALLLLGVAWSVSDFRLRLFLSYEKDDYRDAAALAHNALVRGEPVLWRASGETANYYGLRTTEDTQTGSTARLGAMASVSGDCSLKWFEQSLKDHGEVLVVMSDKSDLFDQGGVCRKTLDSLSIEHVAIFPSFDVWQVTGVKSSLVSF